MTPLVAGSTVFREWKVAKISDVDVFPVKNADNMLCLSVKDNNNGTISRLILV